MPVLKVLHQWTKMLLELDHAHVITPLPASPSHCVCVSWGREECKAVASMRSLVLYVGWTTSYVLHSITFCYITLRKRSCRVVTGHRAAWSIIDQKVFWHCCLIRGLEL